MKKQLLFMMFMAIVAMNFASCSSSDEATNEQGTQLKLSAGITAQREPYDINEWGTNIDIGSIDASAAKESKVRVDKALTRNTVDNDNWVGMSNRNIAVQAGGLVYQYNVDASGNLTSNSPYYFTTTSNISVASWYPYSASLGTFAVQTDQTSFANYEKSDLLYATTTVNQSSPTASLTYAHKTVKVIFRVTINNSQYLYDPTINGVTLSNVYYKGNVSNGNITATDKGTIKMYNNVASSTSNSNVTTATFEACVVPQTSAISYVVTYGAGTYSCSISSATLQAGRIYTCDITMNVLQYADLGLPSGVKWARLNVGAQLPADEGTYYYIMRDGYPTLSNGERVPTQAECDELLNSGTWTWTSAKKSNGGTVYGGVVTVSKGNSIFLPAVGYIWGSGYPETNPLSGYNNVGFYVSTKQQANAAFYGIYFSETVRASSETTSDRNAYGDNAYVIRPVHN
jgi:hypothetical protein